MEYWPTTIPQRPLQDGLSVSLPDNRKVTEMEAGPAKIRLKATTAPTPHRCTYPMTKAELDYFRAFYMTTTHYGTDTFYWPAWWLFTDDASPVYLEARFAPRANPPSYMPNDCDFTVSVELEVWE